MFFGNKKLQIDNDILRDEINSLKMELDSKNDYIKELEQELQKKEEFDTSYYDDEIELIKHNSSHSQEEGIVVFDVNGNEYFKNKLASINIPNAKPVFDAIT
jgi:mannitol/fructose-specific phosphotransferase system IIA component (Ntr-type)